MNIYIRMEKNDLNLLTCLHILLEQKSVSKAANHMGISQPAMSHSLARLRKMFNDPLLIRTSKGMSPTPRAEELGPKIREILALIDTAIQPQNDFDAQNEKRIFRIMASDYAESTILPVPLGRLREQAPKVSLDIMTPSDVSFQDLESGRIDLAINRFDSIPGSLHQRTIWRDSFGCLLSRDNPICDNFTLENYLAAQHVWVSKTGMGVGTGVNPDDVRRLGWVDSALAELDHKRNITVYTRHYQVAMLMAEQKDLVATLPIKAARLQGQNPKLALKKPPFFIPHFDLKMAWSPLLHHDPGHQWIRHLIVEVARKLDGKAD